MGEDVPARVTVSTATRVATPTSGVLGVGVLATSVAGAISDRMVGRPLVFGLGHTNGATATSVVAVAGLSGVVWCGLSVAGNNIADGYTAKADTLWRAGYIRRKESV